MFKSYTGAGKFNGIFVDAPMNSPARVDILIGTKIISLAFIDAILDHSKQKLHMLEWMRDIKILPCSSRYY